MHLLTRLTCTLLLTAALTNCAHADIAAIHASALPHDPAIQSALKDAAALEPYTHTWAPTWNFPIARPDAAARLSKDLAALNTAATKYPANLELQLLTGLVARYAYNVDVDASYDSATIALDAAEKLAPTDLRAPWFRAALKCQTTQPTPGADAFLALESAHTAASLPAAFWLDDMECAAITGMPAHVLRAEAQLQQLRAPASPERTLLATTAHQRFQPFDPTKTYAATDVWKVTSAGDDTRFTSTLCGLQITVLGYWKINQVAFTSGSCIASFGTGPYPGTDHALSPSVAVMVQQPTADETLDAYAKRLTAGKTFTAFTPTHCPAVRCLAFQSTTPKAYDINGDGHSLMLFFERTQPAFPGLVLESPSDPPPPVAGSDTTVSRPGQTLQRIPGRLFYVVMLDTASSIDTPASKDFDFLLTHLTIE